MCKDDRWDCFHLFLTIRGIGKVGVVDLENGKTDMGITLVLLQILPSSNGTKTAVSVIEWE